MPCRDTSIVSITLTVYSIAVIASSLPSTELKSAISQNVNALLSNSPKNKNKLKQYKQTNKQTNKLQGL